MWPTQLSQSVPPSRWSERGLRARLLASLGVVAIVLSASIALWLSIRNGQPGTPVYGTPRLSTGTVWIWDGTTYTLAPAGGPAPTSNNADMAYDRTRGVVVLWDHGCANMVMGFQGGCAVQVNLTWTWDGRGWTAHSPASAPKDVGQGAMLYDSRAGQVVYVNGAGQIWGWTGSDWTTQTTRGAPSIAPRDSGIVLSTFATGYDETRNLLVFVVPSSTWLFDGSTWSEVQGGISGGEARADAHLVYDRAHGQLVYVGSRYTWTWDGKRWQQHDQPAISAGTLGYDPVRATVMLVQQDSSACDRTACRTTTWTWNSKTWVQVPVDRGPQLPLTRSGAFAPPMAFDEARTVMVFFVSAN
jgi:hypothetical protein